MIDPTINNFFQTLPQIGYKDVIRQKLDQSLSTHGENWKSTLNELQVDNLNNHELAEIYLALAEKGSHARLLFEIQDFIYRRAHTQETSADELQSALVGTPFADLIQKVATDPKKLLPIIKTGQVAEMRFGTLPDKIEEPIPTYKRVLHASPEYTGAILGGAGSVTEQLSLAQNELGQDARVITPFYDFYISDFPNAKFVGLVEHFYKGNFVTSSIYKVDSQNGRVKQYLVKPDPAFAPLNDIGTEDNLNIYISKSPESKAHDRNVLYFTSASSAFAASFVGGKRLHPFNILHIHAKDFSLAGEIIHKRYNPIRKEAGLDRIAQITHIHSCRTFEQKEHNPLQDFTLLGLEKPNDDRNAFNLLARGYTYSDADIIVSESYLKDHLTTKKGGHNLHDFVNAKCKQGRMYGIQNGIALEKYSPLNQNNLGDFAFAQTFDTNGIDTTDYLTQRERVKQALFDKGLIADPKKPLFLFVGRIGLDKGIDTIPSMAEEVIKKGGQCVIMGERTEKDHDANSVLDAFKQQVARNGSAIKIYETKSDQKDAMEGTQVSKGSLIRLASDFFLVPSHTEAGGLVVKEGWANGSIAITSNVEGIADNGRGLGKQFKDTPVTKDNFNSFTYEDNFRFKSHAKHAVDEAIDYWENTSTEEKNRTVGRLIEEGKSYDWKLPEGPFKAINKVYDKAVEEPKPEHVKEMEQVERRFNLSHNRSFLQKIGSALASLVLGIAKIVKTILWIPIYPFVWLFRKKDQAGQSH